MYVRSYRHDVYWMPLMWGIQFRPYCRIGCGFCMLLYLFGLSSIHVIRMRSQSAYDTVDTYWTHTHGGAQCVRFRAHSPHTTNTNTATATTKATLHSVGVCNWINYYTNYESMGVITECDGLRVKWHDTWCKPTHWSQGNDRRRGHAGSNRCASDCKWVRSMHAVHASLLRPTAAQPSPKIACNTCQVSSNLGVLPVHFVFSKRDASTRTYTCISNNHINFQYEACALRNILWWQYQFKGWLIPSNHVKCEMPENWYTHTTLYNNLIHKPTNTHQTIWPKL